MRVLEAAIDERVYIVRHEIDRGERSLDRRILMLRKRVKLQAFQAMAR